MLTEAVENLLSGRPSKAPSIQRCSKDSAICKALPLTDPAQISNTSIIEEVRE